MGRSYGMVAVLAARMVASKEFKGKVENIYSIGDATKREAIIAAIKEIQEIKESDKTGKKEPKLNPLEKEARFMKDWLTCRDKCARGRSGQSI